MASVVIVIKSLICIGISDLNLYEIDMIWFVLNCYCIRISLL